jgi:phenylacetate-CoA ligase
MSTYFEVLDFDRLRREYPTGEDFEATYARMSRDELRHLQEERLRRVLHRAWQIRFYRDRWSAAGAEPGDVTGLDDLHLIPTYEKPDLMASVERNPPFGEVTGLDTYPPDARPPVVVQTTSGTTGTPQPLVFGPWGREVANLLLGRLYRWLGVGRGDVIHSVYGHGLINGGHYLREAITHFTEAVFLSAGTGVETRSVQQVAIMHRFGATVLAGFADYLRRLAEVARSEGLEPGVDIPLRMIIGHLPAGSRDPLEEAWGGVPAYDWYGVADTGTVAGEGPDRDGLYVWEDAHHLEILTADGQEADPGEAGDMVVTCLYKDDVFPVVRFNTHDVSAWLSGENSTAMVFRRIAGFLGRSDSMVKIRGINVYPHAIAGIIGDIRGLTGEYFCRAETRADGREELVVVVEHTDPSSDAAPLAELLRRRLGIGVEVALVAPGETAATTGVDTRQKPRRLVDERRP